MVVDSTAGTDPYYRYHAVTIDNPIPTVFWKGEWYDANEDKVTTAKDSFHYEKTYKLSTGWHTLEYAVSNYLSDGGPWHAVINTNDRVVADEDTSVYDHIKVQFLVVR